MGSGGSRILNYYDSISEIDYESSVEKLLTEIFHYKEKERITKEKRNYPNTSKMILDFRKWVNDNYSDELSDLYSHILVDKKLSVKIEDNTSEHFWLAFERYGEEWLRIEKKENE